MKLRNILLVGMTSISLGCSTLPKDQDRFYYQCFRPIPQGVIQEYDKDGDGLGDLRFIYELTGRGEQELYFELRAIQEDKNRNGVYEQSETIIIPNKQLEFEKL